VHSNEKEVETKLCRIAKIYYDVRECTIEEPCA